MYETFLSSVPILASLQVYERAKIADALESRTYEPGEQIIAEGEAGEEFYLVENGKAIVEKSGMGVIGELSRGDYFGGAYTLDARVCVNDLLTVLIPS